MKFKYKKIIILITMCTMCIGLVTISLSTPKEEEIQQTVENNEKQNATVKSDKSTNEKNQETKNSDKKDVKTTEETGKSKDESDLKANQNEKINQLIQTYLDATLACDKDTLEQVVTRIENVDMAELEAKKKLVEEYQNVECYTMDGIKEGDYLVYVYSELKFTGVDTAAPGLMRLYVITEDDETVKIQLGLQSQEIQELIEKADESEEVKKIINTVNYKLEEAINNDSTLRDFYSKLNGGSDEVENDGQENANHETAEE